MKRVYLRGAAAGFVGSSVRRTPEHLLFLGSGTSGLMVEVLFFREFGLLFGNTAAAAAVTLSIFFLGFAAGGRAWGARSGQTRPLRLYAGLELGVSLAALSYAVYRSVGPQLNAALQGITTQSFFYEGLLDGAVAGVALLGAAFFMGGTFPAMGQHIVGAPGRWGAGAAVLYGVNTFGGVAGVILAGFLLPRHWGYHDTLLFAAGLAALVGALGFALDRVRREPSPVDAVRAPSGPRSAAGTAGARGSGRAPEAETAPGPATLAALALASGALVLAIEVLWTRMFAQVLQNSVYSFSIVLAVFLAALGIGSGIASALARSRWRPDRVLIGLLSLAGVATSASGLLFVALSKQLAAPVAAGAAGSQFWELVALASLVVLPAGALAGTVFPFLFKMEEKNGRQGGDVLGRLVAANAVGAVLGPAFAGFLFLPWLGLWTSIRMLGFLYLIAAGLLLASRPESSRVLRYSPVAVIALLAIILEAVEPTSVRVPADGRLLNIDDGSLVTVSVVEESDGNRKLVVNNGYVVGDSRSAGTQRMQAHVPLLLHPNPRRVFFLGLGTGITAGAALDHPVEDVTVAELVPEVVEAARRFFAPEVNGLFDDPRVGVLRGDGRLLLDRSTHRYDVVISDLIVPWHAGAGALYSVEHFRNVAEALDTNGLFVQWLPLYQLTAEQFLLVTRALLEVFPRVAVWRANFSSSRPVLGLAAGSHPISLDPDVFVRRGERLFPDLAGNAEALLDLAGLFYAGSFDQGAPALNRYEVMTLDRPLIELGGQPARVDALIRGEGLTGVRLIRFQSATLGHVPPGDDPYLRMAPRSVGTAVHAGRELYRLRVAESIGDLRSVRRIRLSLSDEISGDLIDLLLPPLSRQRE